MSRLRVVVLPILVTVLLGGCSKHKTTTAPPPTASIHGVVEHPDGSVDVGALVDAQSIVSSGGMVTINTVQSLAGGVFAFDGLAPGPYTVSVIENDSLAVADTVVAPASGVVVRLEPGVVLRGVALRPDTTDRSGVIVSIDLPTAFTLTDSLGAYELFGVAPGARVVYAYDALTDRTGTRALVAIAGDTMAVDTIRIPAPPLAPARARTASLTAGPLRR